MNLHFVSPERNLSSGLPRRKNYHLLTWLMTIVFFAGSFVSFSQTPEIRKAFRFIDIEQPSKGLSALEQIVKSDPENAANLYYLGQAQLITGDKEKALATFEKGISLDKKEGLNYAGKGQIRLIEKNPTDAKVQLEKALSVSRSKDVQVLKAVAKAYLTDTKYLLDAVNLLNRAKDIENTDPEIYLLLGNASLMQNAQQGGEAVGLYEKAAAADPTSGKAFYKIGKIYEQARITDIAVSSFEKAIAADPEYAPAYKELGQMYYVEKKADKAVEAYEKYLSISETPGQAKFQYAFFLFMAKDYDKANAIFKEVTTNPDISPIALKYYAYSLIEQDKNEEAKAVLEKYFKEAKPEDLQASDYSYYGKLLLKLDQDSLANESFAKSISMDSTQTDIIELQAKTYSKNKKYPEAIEAYKMLIESRPNGALSQDLYSLGLAYYFTDQFMEADSAFTRLAERQPTMTIGYLWAGRARQNIDSTGVQGLAKPMYDSVVEKGLQDPEKYKKDLIEAYDYLGTYTLQIKNDVNAAKAYFEKILSLDPDNERAKEFMKQLKG